LPCLKREQGKRWTPNESLTMFRSVPRSLLKPKHWGTWFGVGCLTVLCKLPLKAQNLIARGLARLMLRFSGRQCRIALINLQICYPELDSSDHAVMLDRYLENYCLAIIQSPLIWWSDPNVFMERNEIRGIEHMDSHMAQGRGVIILYSHCIALDFGAVAMSAGRSMYGFYNPFKNPVIDWVHQQGRERFGGIMVSREESFRTFMKAVKAGSAVVYLCDEDFGPDGSVYAPFFGRAKSTLTMLSRIVSRTGAVVVPVFTYYEQETGKFVTELEPALLDYPANDELENATRINAVIEGMIRRHPEHYLWKLKYFKTAEDGSNVYR